MKATELRIGNLIEYKIKDKLDERKEWWEISKVDFQDLTWLDSNPEDADFRPIKLTEEWLLKFGFEDFEDYFVEFFDNGDIRFFICAYMDSPPSVKIKYVHQLQNLYFALKGQELTQVSEGEK